MRRPEPDRPWPWWVWTLIAAPIVVFLALAPFDQPACDDFWYATGAQDHGLWNVQHFWYVNWCGRYTATAVQTGFPLVCDLIDQYAWIPLTMLPAFLVAVWLFLTAANRALGGPASRREVALGSLLFISVYLQQMPSPCESFYWLAATATYLLPMLTGLASVACALAIRRDDAAWRVALAALLAAVLALVTAGGNESLLPLMLVVYCAAGTAAVWRRHRSGWVWAAALVAFSLGAAVMVLAPGNAHRAAYFHKSPLVAFVKVQPHLLKWFLFGPLGAGLILLGFNAVQRFAARMPWTARVGGRHVLWAAAAAWGLVLLSVFPAVSVGMGPPNRLLNVTYFLFLGGSSVVMFLLAAWFGNTGRALSAVIPHAQRWGWMLFVSGALLFGNLPWATYDLVCNALPYRHELQARYARLARLASEHDPHPTISRLKHHPKTIRPGNLDDDRAATFHLAGYFGLATRDLKIR